MVNWSSTHDTNAEATTDTDTKRTTGAERKARMDAILAAIAEEQHSTTPFSAKPRLDHLLPGRIARRGNLRNK